MITGRLWAASAYLLLSQLAVSRCRQSRLGSPLPITQVGRRLSPAVPERSCCSCRPIWRHWGSHYVRFDDTDAATISWSARGRLHVRKIISQQTTQRLAFARRLYVPLPLRRGSASSLARTASHSSDVAHFFQLATPIERLCRWRNWRHGQPHITPTLVHYS